MREDLVSLLPPLPASRTHTIAYLRVWQTSGTPSTSFMGNLYGNPRGGMDLDEAQFKFIAVTMSAGTSPPPSIYYL